MARPPKKPSPETAANLDNSALKGGSEPQASNDRTASKIEQTSADQRLNRALKFQKAYAKSVKENADTHDFYRDFLQIFGVNHRDVGSFERPAKRKDDKRGRIDFFWPGVLLVEHKSAGEDLDKAHAQAVEYYNELEKEERPDFILVSDFQRIWLYDLSQSKQHKILLGELHTNLELFNFIRNKKQEQDKALETVNIKAAELMGEVYDALKQNNYPEHDLERLLVRIVFCLFADNTGIFEKRVFRGLIENTKQDGSDLGSQLHFFFRLLNQEEERRQTSLAEPFNKLRYINGQLFADNLEIPAFDTKIRATLLKAADFDWSKISPAIFGSLFQSVADKEKRRSFGEHYTSEANILKVLRPLFLDELQQEYDKLSKTKNNLLDFQTKLNRLRFFDPACGSGNFLVICFRELRKIENDLLKALHQGKDEQMFLSDLSKISVASFYGIEINEFPAKIAELALWLMEHLMNRELSVALGHHFANFPLKSRAAITQGNALSLDWQALVLKDDLLTICGNPPFIGSSHQTLEQKADLRSVFNKVKSTGQLDYVAGWYAKAADYIQNTKIKVGFVSTNSIAQGEQVGILWRYLFQNVPVKIHFAHQTFVWDSEAQGKAHVHVVIIGFAAFDRQTKRLFSYTNPKADPQEVRVANINPYLLASKDKVILRRAEPFFNILPMIRGNIPYDGGNLLLTDSELQGFIQKERNATPFIKPLLGADEFLSSKKRWCLWLVDANPAELQKLLSIMERIQKVKEMRLSSISASTRKMAGLNGIFGQVSQPNNNYILIPRVSSEKREYVPMAFLPADCIVHDSAIGLPGANLYHFGVLMSKMHNVWMRQVAGRLESRYRYSNTLVYNNFAWPDQPKENLVQKVEEKARQIVVLQRKFAHISFEELYDPLKHHSAFIDKPEPRPSLEEYFQKRLENPTEQPKKDKVSLGDLYDPKLMPPDLTKAHQELDRAVDACYGKKFNSDPERIEFLFDLYDRYIEQEQKAEPKTEAKARSKNAPSGDAPENEEADTET